MRKTRRKKKPPKRVLALPDLEQTKSAILNTLPATPSLIALGFLLAICGPLPQWTSPTLCLYTK